MQVRELKIESFEGFLKFIDAHKNYEGLRLFRGQRKSRWNLDSQQLRLVMTNNRLDEIYDIEKRLFTEFKNGLKQYRQDIDGFSDWYILSIAQHYKLPTRLLDWSSDPLVALWFAFNKKECSSQYRAVWGLSIQEENIVNTKTDDPFSGRFVKVFQPLEADVRFAAQKAWFSVQNMNIRSSKRSGDGLPHFNDETSFNTMNLIENYEYQLIKIIIPNDQRSSIMADLDQRGINKQSLFPKLDKLGKRLRLKEFGSGN